MKLAGRILDSTRSSGIYILVLGFGRYYAFLQQQSQALRQMIKTGNVDLIGACVTFHTSRVDPMNHYAFDVNLCTSSFSYEEGALNVASQVARRLDACIIGKPLCLSEEVFQIDFSYRDTLLDARIAWRTRPKQVVSYLYATHAKLFR